MTKFEATPEILHTFKPPIIYLEDVAKTKKIIPSSDVRITEISHMISTVKDNLKSYTQKFDYSKEARQLDHIIGNTTTENYKHLLR